MSHRTSRPLRNDVAGSQWEPAAGVGPTRFRLLSLIAPFARPWPAMTIALLVYLIPAALAPNRLQSSRFAYFNYLADAFLHGQVSLRLQPPQLLDLVLYDGRLYLYWPPFPAIAILPLVALFGVGVSDVMFTVVVGAATIGLLARFLAALDDGGVTQLGAERRAILVVSVAFGTVLVILIPGGTVWYTGQVVGWACLLLAALFALTRTGPAGYALTGLALACATATRTGLIFNGLWLAYYMLRRDWSQPLGKRLVAVFAGLAPLVLVVSILAWYNVARFGNALDMGLAWHQVSFYYRDVFQRYGLFNLRYLPGNLYYHFIVYPPVVYKEGVGGGLFWMTPILLGAFVAVWRRRGDPLIWTLVGSILLSYVPIGLLMSAGYDYGSRYLLDLLVPLLVLTALGIGKWRLDVLQLLMIVGVATFTIGTVLKFFFQYM